MQTAEVMEKVNDDPPVFADQIDPVTHVARCVDCPGDVTFRPTSSGHGFMILSVNGFEPEATFSVGDHGWPVCPNGHGEMALADESLPAHDAITEAARLNDAQQASLPGVFPAFNFEGAYLDLARQAIEVDRLERQAKDDAEVAKDSKKAWEKAAKLHTAMWQTYEQRRREKAVGDAAAQPENAGGQIVPCLFEQRNPQVPCPVCAGHIDATEAKPRDSEGHVEQAQDFILKADVAELCERLEADAGIVVSIATARAWSEEQRADVEAWCKKIGPDAVLPSPWPEALGTAHIAANVEAIPDAAADAAVQTCRECGAVLLVRDDEATAPEWYATGTLVGVDCQGPGQSYPKATKKKGRRK